MFISCHQDLLESWDQLFSIYLDHQKKLHQVLSIETPALYLIRPDGYIAFINQPVNINKIEKYLQTLFL